MKLFTREEAEALIPELERMFAAILEIAARAQMKDAALRRRMESGHGDEMQSVIERSQLQFLATQINERLQEIIALGAMPKGIEPALVDFPAVIDGREVYLCWRLGEKALTYWHGRDEGFSSRKPLPKRR